VRRAGLIAELHDLADRVRFLYAAGHCDFTTARGLERRLAEIWRARGVIEGQLGDGGDAGVREGIRGDLLDLAILWADLRVQLASDLGRDGARRDALRTLAEAEADWGRSPVLDLERSSYVLALGRGGEAPPADASPIVVSPRTAWEWYALGRSLLRSGKLDDAAVAYDRAAELQPQGLWTQFYRGQCALRRGRFAEAVDAFGASVALAPGAGVCYFNRGLAYEGLGVHDRARLDLERARRLDPKLAGPAWEAIPRPLNPADPPRREAGPSRDH
jgi:tetratricopeptide (TPR) repeat protein